LVLVLRRPPLPARQVAEQRPVVVTAGLPEPQAVVRPQAVALPQQPAEVRPEAVALLLQPAAQQGAGEPRRAVAPAVSPAPHPD
jgi:hypothetical protein